MSLFTLKFTTQRISLIICMMQILSSSSNPAAQYFIKSNLIYVLMIWGWYIQGRAHLHERHTNYETVKQTSTTHTVYI